MFFPIGDENVRGGYKPIFSYAFLVMNILVFIYQVSMLPELQEQFIVTYGSIPYELSSGQDYYTIFTSMFMHGGWMHLIGNMVFLWVFADNIEAIVGNAQFAIFYILGGVAASLGQTLANPASSIPCVGASGAIAAVLGAYLVMFPSSKIRVLVLVFFSSFYMPAIAFLGIWIVQQLISGFGALNVDAEGAGGGVAWRAHIGGFAFGVVAGLLFRGKLKDVNYVETA